MMLSNMPLLTRGKSSQVILFKVSSKDQSKDMKFLLSFHYKGGIGIICIIKPVLHIT